MEELLRQQLLQIDCIDDSTIVDNLKFISLKKNILGDVKNISENHVYLLELENYIINPPSGFNLADNWNNGISPKSKYLKADICKVLGNMICVNARGYNLDTNEDNDDFYDQLWLPRKSVKIIKELI